MSQRPVVEKGKRSVEKRAAGALFIVRMKPSGEGVEEVRPGDVRDSPQSLYCGGIKPS